MSEIGLNIVGRKSAAIFAVANGTPQQVVAATVGKKIRVHGYLLAGNTAADVLEWRDGASTIIGRSPGGSVSPCAPCVEGWFETAAGNALNIQATAGTVYVGHLIYSLVD